MERIVDIESRRNKFKNQKVLCDLWDQFFDIDMIHDVEVVSSNSNSSNSEAPT